MRLFLPRAETGVGGEGRAAARTPSGRGETILVVEDDPDVRVWSTDFLRVSSVQKRRRGNDGSSSTLARRERPAVFLR